MINTHKKGVLWSNYLAPFLTGAFNNQNRLDLIMGEGTYSANSIYLLRDLNSSGTPSFDEDHMQKLIPGMGIEQITPVVLDWNNDGKPDILCGDRTGFLDLYINNSTDADHPTFAPPVHVKIGRAGETWKVDYRGTRRSLRKQAAESPDRQRRRHRQLRRQHGETGRSRLPRSTHALEGNPASRIPIIRR